MNLGLIKNFIKTINKFNPLESAIFILSMFVNGINFTGYPIYSEDEGTYISQALAFTHYGKLAIYTYWYDHVPAGWIFLGFWEWILSKINVLNNNFVFSIDSGRFFILILVSFSAIIVYRITYKITQNKLLSVISSILFICSPLSIDYHRRVLLDNIMTFWLLICFNCISNPKVYLSSIIISCISFSLAVLSKESALLFLPAILVAIYFGTERNKRYINFCIWITLFFILISIYPLYAILKGEFFQSGTLFGGSNPHVSLIEATFFQTHRVGNWFIDVSSESYKSFHDSWLFLDAFYFFSGIISTILLAVINFFYLKKSSYWALITSLFIYEIYLIKGPIFGWYIIPLIPFFSIIISICCNLYLESIRIYFNLQKLRVLLSYLPTLLIIIILLFNLNQHHYSLFFDKATLNQINAVNWARNNIDKTSIVLIDNYSFTDLNGYDKDIQATKFHYFWKVDSDPEVKYSILENKWQKVDFLIVTLAFKHTLNLYDLPIVNSAYQNSLVIKKFEDNSTYPVEIRKVIKNL